MLRKKILSNQKKCQLKLTHEKKKTSFLSNKIVTKKFMIYTYFLKLQYQSFFLMHFFFFNLIKMALIGSEKTVPPPPPLSTALVNGGIARLRICNKASMRDLELAVQTELALQSRDQSQLYQRDAHPTSKNVLSTVSLKNRKKELRQHIGDCGEKYSLADTWHD